MASAASAKERKLTIEAFADERPGGGAFAGIDGVDGGFGVLFRGEENIFAVGGPEHVVDIAVEGVAEIYAMSRGAVVEHEAPAVGFVFRHELCAIGD